MGSLDTFATDFIAALDRDDLQRHPVETERVAPGIVRQAGRELVSFSCNDYLNLSHHPAVKQAAVDATLRHGAGGRGPRGW